MKRDQFLHLADKLDIIDERVDGVEKLLALQQQSLEYHIKRTDTAEANLQLLQSEILRISQVESNVRSNVNLIGKFVAYVGGLSAFILVLLQIYQVLNPS